MSFIKKLESEYTRRIQLEPEREMIMYISLIGLCIILFVAFGARTHLGNYLENRKYEAELSKVLMSKRAKLRLHSTLLETYNKNLTAIEQFNQYMPNNLQEQDYLIDFVTQAANQGYIVDTWNVLADKSTHNANIDATLTGTWENAANLVKSIENQKRPSIIKSVVITPTEDGLVEIDLELMIFYKPI